MARYVSYTDRLERRSRNGRLFLRLFILVVCFFVVTHFFVRIYKVKDSLSSEIPRSSLIVATFYYPFFGKEPKRGDLVFVQSFPSHFWSLEKMGEIFSFSLLKANWWGRERLNIQRLYKIIAKGGDRVRHLDGYRIAVRAFEDLKEAIYSLPKKSPPFWEISPLTERTLEEGEYLGVLTGAGVKEAVHAFRFLTIDEIVAQARVHFSF